jgi:E3 ubiquitin-protein ligase HERC1
LNPYFVEEIAVGAEHALALTSTGDVWGWGNNGDGQLGLGHTAIVRDPQLVATLLGKGAKQVSFAFYVLLPDAGTSYYNEHSQ